jgi:hypothetical protein
METQKGDICMQQLYQQKPMFQGKKRLTTDWEKKKKSNLFWR